MLLEEIFPAHVLQAMAMQATQTKQQAGGGAQVRARGCAGWTACSAPAPHALKTPDPPWKLDPVHTHANARTHARTHARTQTYARKRRRRTRRGTRWRALAA